MFCSSSPSSRFWIAFLFVAQGCATEPDEPCRGAESCECYANGTCDDGLSCLSDHCVDVTPELGDAALDAALGVDDASMLGARDAAGNETTTRVTSRRTGTTAPVNPDTQDDSETTASESDGATSPTDTTGEPTTDELESNDDSNTTGQDESVTSNDQTEEQTEDTTSDGTTSTTASTGSEEPTSDVTGTSTDTSTADTSTSDTTTTSEQTSTDDVTSVEPGAFPALPARTVTALDESSPDGTVSASCPSPLIHNDLCYSSVACSSAPCEASFEWIGISVSIFETIQPLVLRDLSGDGTVLLADWGTGTNTRGVVLRWGASTLTRLTTENASFASAINFDATWATGTRELCAGSDCEYPAGRFGQNNWELAPNDISMPTDISDEITIVSSDRPEFDIVSTIWSTGEPTLVDGLVLESLSGDAQFAAGTFDQTGQLVLYYANGTKPVPSTGDYIYHASTAVNADGSVVVSNAWGAGTSTSPMVHWTTNKDLVSPGTVTMVHPTGEFTDVVPFGVNGAGSVVVGTQSVGVNSDPRDTEAFYWDAPGGLRSLKDELADRGLTLPNDVYLHAVYISADGSTLVGQGSYESTSMIWRVRLTQ